MSQATTADDAAGVAAAEAAPSAAAPIVQAPARPLVKVRRWELVLITCLAGLLYLPRLGAGTLWDPWETHYGEVARRMLADDEWIQTKWQNEPFRSKPVLTFWLMAAGMEVFGVAKDGGYSGEMVSNPYVEWAIRLPFSLFGVAGLVLLFYALARLYSRRAAWIATTILATCPYYFFISRQAITDMPSCAMLVGAVALFALFALDEDRELRGPLAHRRGHLLFRGLLAAAFIVPALVWLVVGPSVPARVTGAITIALVAGLSVWRGRAETRGGGVPWAGFSAVHVFLVGFLAVAMWQLGMFIMRTQGTPLRFSPTSGVPGPYMILPFVLGLVLLTEWIVASTRRISQVYMYWFFVLAGVALLAKGPVMPFLASFTVLVYLICSADWGLLRRMELPRGILIAVVVGIPWHVAMFLKDGRGWWNEYFGQHILNRAISGVHGDRGTFEYFLSQMGVGMWPWAALVPAALVPIAFAGRAKTREERLRLLFGVWAITAFFFFCAVQTKFHHYILPAVPALAAVVAFYLDDLIAGRVRWPAAGLAVALGIFVVMSVDLLSGGELKLVNLFIYRYDRPWPSGPPWNISFGGELLAFVIAMGVALLAFALTVAARAKEKVRIAAAAAPLVTAVAFAVFAIQILMVAASPHWGQKHLHQTYYQKREIHGVDLIYDGLRELRTDFPDGKTLRVRSVIPETLGEGAPMTVTVQAAGDTLTLTGAATQIDRAGDAFSIVLDDASRERLAPLVDQAAMSHEPPRKRVLSVNADRLLAWQLNWRGENFQSGGEIYQQRVPDAQTVFIKTDNVDFKKYMDAPERTGKGRRFFVITEKGRLTGFPGALSGKPLVKQTFKVEDDSSNKFGLGSFQLDGVAPEAPAAKDVPSDENPAPEPAE